MTANQSQENMHPLLGKRDQKSIQSRIQCLMKRDGLDALILVKAENVLYATGYYSKFAYLPGVPAGSSAVVVLPADGEPHLFIDLMENDDAPRQTTGIEVSAMPGFVFVDDSTPESHQERSANLDPLAGFKDALDCALDSAPNARIGIEKAALPAGFLGYLNRQVETSRALDCNSLIMEARLNETAPRSGCCRRLDQEHRGGVARVRQFNDLIKNLKLGFMGAFGATRDKWTLFADLIYLDVEDNTKSTVSVLGNPVRTKVDLTLKGFITTFGGAYRFLETDTTRLNVLAGARYLWLETDLDLNLDLDDLGLSASGSESGYLWDGIVGLRGKTNLNEKWYLTYYADVGTGNSEITWQALGAVNYRFQRFDASLGYRYAEWRVDDGALLNFEKLDLHGPFLGLKFRF